MAHHHHHHQHKSHSKDENSWSGSSHQSSGERASTKTDPYGVWKGTPLSYTGQTLEQDKSPHLTLNFSDESGSKTYQAEINVASTSKETNLVYWVNRSWTHPLTATLSALTSDFHQATTTDGTGLSLDFLRTSPALLNIDAGQIVQDSDASKSNDILSELEPIIKDAIADKANVYIFGGDYKTGIHDVHMNQGNTGSFANAVGVDGALIFGYTDGHFEAVFLAFAEQEIPTDAQSGAPTKDAKALSTLTSSEGSS